MHRNFQGNRRWNACNYILSIQVDWNNIIWN